MTLIDAAVAFAESGIPVFPIVPKSKVPLTGNGFYAAVTDTDQIGAWWITYPQANVGIPTGERSGFWVLDVDGAAGRQSLAHLEKQNGPLPQTRVFRTGSGGLHYLWTHAPGVRNAVRFVPGLDVRADGGYIVAPPSIHESGNAYAVEVDAPVVPAPAWLLAKVKDRKLPANPTSGGGVQLVEGSRNAGLASMAGRLRRAGLDYLAITAALREHNAAHCAPPLADAEVDAVARSISRYERGDLPTAPLNGAGHSAPDKPRTAPTEEGRKPGAALVAELRPVRAPEFVAKERPARNFLLNPWLREKSLTLVYAPRGVGKSWFSMTVALAAAGGFDPRSMGWSVPVSSLETEVLYLDAEMAGDDFAQRIKCLCEEVYLPERLSILSADDLDGPLPSLATPEGRVLIEQAIDGYGLVILDNVSTLWSGMGDQNAAESWDVAQTWLLELRRRGHAVVLVDHSGKTPGRGARGTSRKEDIMDVCLELTRPDDADPEDGAVFTLKWTKKRGLFGSEFRDKRWRLKATLPHYVWQVRDDEADRAREVGELSARGMSERAIERELEIPRSTVQRLLKRYRNAQGDVPMEVI